MANYSKLRDGSWGVRGASAEVRAGAVITITTKAGRAKTETVGRVLWTGDGVALATLERGGGRSYQPGSNSGYAMNLACGYPCPVTGSRCTPQNLCHDCE